jgi:hypothetical protein
MNYRSQSMRLGLVVLAGMSIVLGGWLMTGPVALAGEEGHDHKLKVLADRIAGAQLTLVQAIQAAEKATGGVAVEVEYELEDDGLEIEVEVLVDGKMKEVEFDAMTGKQMMDDDDDEHDDDEEHEHDDDDDDD